MKFLRYVTFIVLTFAMTFSFAEEPQQITPEHKAAINHMLQAFHVEEIMRFGMQKGFDKWGIQLITVMLKLCNGTKVTPSWCRLPAQLCRVSGMVSG